MTPIVILGCGASKVDLLPGEVVPIADLYCGNVYRKRHQYAQIFGGPHYILSGHHGLVAVDIPVPTYELDLRTAPGTYRRAWCERVLRTLGKLVDPATPIVVLAQGNYLAWCQSAREAGYRIEAPLEGKTMGEGLAWLKRAIGGRAPIVEPNEDGRDYRGEADAIRAELERDVPADDEEFLIATGALRELLGIAPATRGAA